MSVAAKLVALVPFGEATSHNSAMLLAALVGAALAAIQFVRVVLAKFSSGKGPVREENGGGGARKKKQNAKIKNSAASQSKTQHSQPNSKTDKPAAPSAAMKEKEKAKPEKTAVRPVATSSPRDDSDSEEEEEERVQIKGKKGKKGAVQTHYAVLEEEVLPYVVPSDDAKWETVTAKKASSVRPATAGTGAGGPGRGVPISDNQRKNAKRQEKRDLVRDLMQQSQEDLKASKLSTKAKVNRIPSANNYVIGADFL